uniref:Uncharacterized protein n=1 Tax=Ralstonia syzygii R24 TaxID=907261 RepID=G3A6T2_9RALS|nr:hypothetical protein RALSY_40401 [Ralstonia syzygii R24]
MAKAGVRPDGLRVSVGIVARDGLISLVLSIVEGVRIDVSHDTRLVLPRYPLIDGHLIFASIWMQKARIYCSRLSQYSSFSVTDHSG